MSCSKSLSLYMAELGLELRGSGTRGHMLATWLPDSHIPAPTSAISASHGNAQRRSCARHIMADYSSHWHTCQASTRPWQGRLPAYPWLPLSFAHTSDPHSASPSTLPTSANCLHPLPIISRFSRSPFLFLACFTLDQLKHRWELFRQPSMSVPPTSSTTFQYTSLGLFVCLFVTPVIDPHQEFCDHITLF